MDFFQESFPLKEKKEKINKLVNSLVEDKGLFQKFKHMSTVVKRDQQKVNHRVLDPLSIEAESIEQRNHIIAPFYANYVLNKRRMFKDINQFK